MRFSYPVLLWQHSVLSAASVSVFTFCRVSLPRVAWLKQELLARDCAFWVGLAGQCSGHSWTRSGGCGHLMPCLAGAGELQMTAPVCGGGAWCWVLSRLLPRGSLIHCLLSQASLPGKRSVPRKEKGRLQGSLRPQIWNTHSVTLLCPSGENKSQGQPDSRSGE